MSPPKCIVKEIILLGAHGHGNFMAVIVEQFGIFPRALTVFPFDEDNALCRVARAMRILDGRSSKQIVGMLGGSIDGVFNDFLGGVQEERLQVFIPLLGKTCRATLDSIDGVGGSSYRICLMSQIINSFEIGQETMAMEVLIMVIIDGKFIWIFVIHGVLGIGKLA